MERLFDLNIEKVLENWNLEHALREIIANAIDEQILTGSRDIEIYQDSQRSWRIRDYGRGLQYIHFTQNDVAESSDCFLSEHRRESIIHTRLAIRPCSNECLTPVDLI